MHRVIPALPWMMEHGFILLTLDSTEPMHAAHVVNAVHAQPSCQCRSNIASWVPNFRRSVVDDIDPSLVEVGNKGKSQPRVVNATGLELDARPVTCVRRRERVRRLGRVPDDANQVTGL